MKRSILAALIALLLPIQTLAAPLTPERYKALQYDAVYDDGTLTGTCNSTIPASTNLPAPIIDGINHNKSFYEAASQQTGVPWQVLAAIHYKETGLKRYNPGNGQGVYQNLNGGFTPADTISDDEFARQTLLAAHFVQNIATTDSRLVGDHKKALTESSNDPEAFKDIFFSYNGRAGAYADQAARLGFNPATQPYEGSPYVMNNFDSVHLSMLKISKDHGAPDTIDHTYGAFVIFQALTGIAACGGASGNKIVDTAAQQIGASETDGSYLKYTGGRAEAWCADFVSWVYNQAGTPVVGDFDGWRIAGAARLANWFRNNGLWSERKDNAFAPQPGDVVQFLFTSSSLHPNDHIGIVEKVDGTTLHTIEGNTSNKVARRTYQNYLNDSEIIGWGRKK